MFLRGFKLKSQYKFINKQRTAGTVAHSQGSIKSIGVVINLAEFDDIEAFREFMELQGINYNHIKLMLFNHDHTNEVNFSETICTPRDFGWGGTVKNDTVKRFLDTEFDALISYYNSREVELSLLTACSKANFKIGLAQQDDRFNDLIINLKPKDFDLFRTELVKYLKILKKL